MEKQEGYMEPSKITALIPIMNGPAKGCMVVYEDGRRCRRFCTVERYMNTLAAFMGNDNRACRKLFDRKRGTGILLNDGSIFVQIRMTDRVPTLGYVRLDAIRGFYTGDSGKCVLRLAGAAAARGAPARPLGWCPREPRHRARVPVGRAGPRPPTRRPRWPGCR